VKPADRAAAPPPPDPDRVAAVFFDDTLIYRYVDMLATAGVERGLIGPREAPRLWERHIFNCAAAAAAFGPDGRVADVGSGAGLPGLVLALARPDLDVTLIEPLLRRTTFLSEVVADLGLSNVTVLRSRAEDVDAGVAGFDAVTSRAVAPLPKLVGWCLPLTRPGGLVLAMKGASADTELAASWPALRRLGVTSARVEEYPVAGTDPTRVVRIESP
jgi:16S rRNA (guanine527-N7)-methyltransferase